MCVCVCVYVNVYTGLGDKEHSALYDWVHLLLLT